MTEEIKVIPTNGTSADDVKYAKKVKEVYIDGINVAKCEFFNDCECKLYKQEYWERTDTTFDFCKEHPLCEYKATAILERLEQERDELKKTVENQKLEYEELQCDLSEVENDCGCYQSENAELKQENKDLKDNNNQLQAIIDDGRAENKRFREENKELKKENIKVKKEFNNLIVEIISDTEYTGEIACNGESPKEHLKQCQKALKALEEIRKIAKDIIENDVYENSDVKAEKILNKIDEVLNKG